MIKVVGSTYKISQALGPDLNKLRVLHNLLVCEKCERPMHGWRILFIWRVVHAKRCRRKLDLSTIKKTGFGLDHRRLY